MHLAKQKGSVLALRIVHLFVFLCLSISQIAFSVQTPTSVPNQPKASKSQLAEKLADLLEIEKSARPNIELSNFLLKKIPQHSDPEVQKQIVILNANSQNEYDKQKVAMLQEIKEKFRHALEARFNESELQYLITLASYKPFVRLHEFLQSSEYEEILAIPVMRAKTLSKEFNDNVTRLTQKSNDSGKSSQKK